MQTTPTKEKADAGQNSAMTETQFRALCALHGGPDEVPCDEMPEIIAATLSMADRFFDEEDTEDAISLIRRAGLFA